MSALIKSRDAGYADTVQRFGHEAVARPDAPKRTVMPIENPLAAENSRLAAVAEKYEAEIAAHADALAKAFADGELAGHTAAETEFEDDRSAALSLLENGIAGAEADLSSVLENAENIAVLVAHTALEKLFGDSSSYKGYVTELIRHQLGRIGQESFVAIEVARADFPDTGEVADLARSLAIPTERLRVLDELNNGDCRMRMQVGTLEVGVDRQWGAMRAMLTEMVADHDNGIQA
jgi:flagellar biosynthesis/type III secretory pathway protein FliH